MYCILYKNQRIRASLATAIYDNKQSDCLLSRSQGLIKVVCKQQSLIIASVFFISSFFQMSTWVYVVELHEDELCRVAVSTSQSNQNLNEGQQIFQQLIL